MKLITRDTDYALRVLCYFAKNKDRLLSASGLVKKLNIPRPFLRKILQILNRRGILESSRGAVGGFRLALPAAKINLTDLIEIFQGKVVLNECLFKKKTCPNRSSCCLRKKIIGIENYVVKELASINIESLLK